MSDTIIREWHFLWYAVATGYGFAFFYDFLRLLRRLFHHGRVMVDIEDLLYWTVCFLISFTLLYYGNHGVIRFFAVLGAGAGMYLYSITLGRFLVKGTYFLICKLCSPFIRFVRFIKNRLTRMTNHFTIKIRGFIRLMREKGEKKRAGKPCKKPKTKKARIPPEKE